jgi:hypothetical protein
MTDRGVSANKVSVASPVGESSGQKKFWKHHIEAWRVSGLSQRAYCQKNNLKDHRFSHWKSRLAKADAGVSFVRVPLVSRLPVPIQRRLLHLHCPNGFRVDISDDFDPSVLKKLLAVLGEVPHAV